MSFHKSLTFTLLYSYLIKKNLDKDIEDTFINLHVTWSWEEWQTNIDKIRIEKDLH